jgi:hypothetical protein
MGAWVSRSPSREVDRGTSLKRRRACWQEGYPCSRTPKHGHQGAVTGNVRVCRGDDVEVIAGPVSLATGQLVPPRDSSHFARVIDPRYERDPEAGVLVVQWYYRLHDLVEAGVPESLGAPIELVESPERALVRTSAVVRRIDVASWSGAGAEFFSGRHTRAFGCVAPPDRAIGARSQAAGARLPIGQPRAADHLITGECAEVAPELGLANDSEAATPAPSGSPRGLLAIS